MKKQIFPKEILEHTYEVHQFAYGKRSTTIYAIILLAIAGVLISLPLIKVDVYATARGIIKSEQERVPLFSIQLGKVVFSRLENHASVGKGDTLLIIENAVNEEKKALVAKQTLMTKTFIADLKLLLSKEEVPLKNLKTERFSAAARLYQQGLDELLTKHQKTQLDFKRDSILYQKEAVSKVAFENTRLEYELSKSKILQWQQQQQSRWEVSLTDFENTLLELQSSAQQLYKNQSQYVLTAPVSGTLLSVGGIGVNSFVSTGRQLGEISPDGTLLVESYVSPSEIGYLQAGSLAKFQIDAFHYNQWGMATGSILSIGKDIEVVSNQAVFKVRCKINEQVLSLKNGFQGQLTKGMTLNVCFFLTERSLFDLLYDKVDNWLNPGNKTITLQKS